MRRLACALMILSGACGPESGAPTSVGDGSGGEADTSGSASTTASGSSNITTASASTTASDGADGSSGTTGDCQSATTPEACAALGGSCSWHATTLATYDPATAACDVQRSGVCIGDHTGEICDVPPTCDLNLVWYRPAADGAIELLVVDDGTGCAENPSGEGFMTCEVVQGTPPVYEPAACGCACA